MKFNIYSTDTDFVETHSLANFMKMYVQII